MNDLTNTIERLREIQDEMMELLLEAKRLVRTTSEGRRAEAYWQPHIHSAIRGGAGSMCSIESTIEALEQERDAQGGDE